MIYDVGEINLIIFNSLVHWYLEIEIYLKFGIWEFKMGKMSIVREFLEFVKVRKKWWLTPIVVMLLLLGALIILTEGSAIAPFIYTLF